jgi:hypothetical protein
MLSRADRHINVRSLVDWQHATKMQDYQKKIVEAYGFPRAENTAKK